MKLRTRLDVFSAALLSALGASQVIACGGSALDGGPSGSAGSPGSAGADVGGSSGAGTAGSGTAGTGDANHFPCKSPKDLGGGLIQCDGFTHRTTSGTCNSTVPRPEPYPTISPSAQCTMDADCIAKPYGWCGGGGQVPGPYCYYGCVKDSDCSSGQLCECGDPVGRCVQAYCTSDADCDAGFLCKGYDTSAGCGSTGYTCESRGDTCGSDADCAGTVVGTRCNFDTVAKHFACNFDSCMAGRPFLVEGKARIAPAASRADWRELALLPRLEELDTALRAELACEWTRIALMEHASIAAFARFSLQLMSLGAPAELVLLTTSAMLDETKHAKACFGVASRYAPSPVGPGCLAIESSLEGTSLEEIVRNTIREGCVGETVAAIEAREAAEHAQDPALKQLLETISEDETKHAELAFRFVQWALSIGDASLQTAVHREFEALAALAQRESNAGATSDNRLLVHGVVSQELRRTIRAQAFTDVILPCARALQAPADSTAQSEASTLSSAS